MLDCAMDCYLSKGLESKILGQNNTEITFPVKFYEAWTLLLNGVSVSHTRIEHRHSYNTRRIRIGEMSNSKNIYLIYDNSNTF